MVRKTNRKKEEVQIMKYQCNECKKLFPKGVMSNSNSGLTFHCKPCYDKKERKRKDYLFGIKL